MTRSAWETGTPLIRFKGADGPVAVLDEAAVLAHSFEELTIKWSYGVDSDATEAWHDVGREQVVVE